MTTDFALEEKVIPSRSVPGKSYTMLRTPGGWQHVDATCTGWAVRNRCAHVKEMNMEEGIEEGQALVLAEQNPLTLIEALEDQAIIKAITGQITETWCYRFSQGGQTVEGLSVDGVEAAARELAKRGEAIREMDCRVEFENEEEARFVARAGRFAVSGDGREVLLDVAIRAKRQGKYMRLKTGQSKFDEHWYEKGVAKAVRNAKEALLPEEMKAVIIAESRKAVHRVHEVQADEEATAKPAARPAKAEVAADPRKQIEAHARSLGIRDGKTFAAWLGTDPARPVSEWMERATAAGRSPGEAAAIAIDALDSVARELKANPASSLPQAVAVVEPLRRLDIPIEPPDAADVLGQPATDEGAEQAALAE